LEASGQSARSVAKFAIPLKYLFTESNGRVVWKRFAGAFKPKREVHE